MRSLVRLTPLFATGMGLALAGLGVAYLVVACQSLPGFMGPTPGDTSPRTGLGIAGLVLGLIAFSVAAVLARRRRRQQ